MCSFGISNAENTVTAQYPDKITYNGTEYDYTGQTNTATATFNQLMAGNGTGSLALLGNSQEIIYWQSDESSNRTGIETDINGFFGIY